MKDLENEGHDKILKERVRDLDSWDERLRFALRDMPVSLYLQDENTRFIWCYNPAPPWTEENLIGKNQFEIGLTPEDAEAINQLTAKVRQSGIAKEEEFWVEPPDGSGSMCFRVSYAPYDLGEGRVGVLTKALDVTRDQQTAQEIRHLAESLEAENTRVNQLLVQVQNESESRLKQLQEASEMQKALLPADHSIAGPYALTATMTTCQEVGGDYYDFLETEQGLTVVIGDATGHGVRAGIMVALVKSFFINFGATHTPLHLLDKLDAQLYSMRLKQMYIGVTALRFAQNRCTYAIAGMPAFYVYRCATNLLESVSERGMFLGTGLTSTYLESSFDLDDGDMVILTSDGLNEAFSPQGEIMPAQRIADAIHSSALCGSNAIVDRLKQELLTWTGKQEVTDDVTIVVVQYSNPCDTIR